MFPRLSRLAPSSPLAESPLAVRPRPRRPPPCCRPFAVLSRPRPLVPASAVASLLSYACCRLPRPRPLAVLSRSARSALSRLRPCPLRPCFAPSRTRDGIAPTSRKFPAPPRGDFAILSFVGAGVVRVGAIGKELGCPKRAATPRAVRFSVIRCRACRKLRKFSSQDMQTKIVSFWTRLSSFASLVMGFLRPSVEVRTVKVRVLFSSFEWVSVMDAGSKGASCL